MVFLFAVNNRYESYEFIWYLIREGKEMLRCVLEVKGILMSKASSNLVPVLTVFD